MTHELRTCPGCKKTHPPNRSGGAVGAAAKDMDAMPSLSNGGGLHYLCIMCARKACNLARRIVELHGGDKNVYLYTLVASDPVCGDPLRKFKESP